MSTRALKQPKSLYLLFFTELWERFGFYTLQTIIILYMSHALMYEDHKAYIVYAVFSALLYLLPVLGGFLADHYLGYQRAIIIGGLLLIVSYAVAALPGAHAFFIALSILICAHGLFKPNVSSLVGTLYDVGDPRREGGFTIFYMGINIGSLIPPLFAGAIVVHYGWHMGFILAAIGMGVGMITFFCGRKILGAHGGVPSRSPLHKGAMKKTIFNSVFYLGIIGFILLIDYAFRYPALVSDVLKWMGILIFLVVFMFLFKEPVGSRKRMFAATVLIIISIGFWALYNQTFTSLMLFAERNMQKSFMGIPLDAEGTQFFNPLFIILLSPMLSRLWTRLSVKDLNPSVPTKFAWGCVFLSLGYFVLMLGVKYFSHDGMTSSGWLVGSYFIQTIGELLISPIALAMITELSPRHLVGMMMGVWFFSNAVSAVFSGTLATFTDVPKHASLETALNIYQHGFLVFSEIAIVLSLIAFILIPFLKGMIRSKVD
ncbi:MAG: peptide MFS transporter [Gammaproteobacteria bacterium]